jgi:hypothetical protein
LSLHHYPILERSRSESPITDRRESTMSAARILPHHAQGQAGGIEHFEDAAGPECR